LIAYRYIESPHSCLLPVSTSYPTKLQLPRVSFVAHRASLRPSRSVVPETSTSFEGLNYSHLVEECFEWLVRVMLDAILLELQKLSATYLSPQDAFLKYQDPYVRCHPR
jgi:hypothetical protein